jgi:hypothetical protein
MEKDCSSPNSYILEAYTVFKLGYLYLDSGTKGRATEDH